MNKTFWVPVLLLAFHLFSASSQLTIGWLNIDCGNNASHSDKNLLPWVTDNGYTQAGINKQVPQKQEPEEMNTLRSFPNKAQENCYALPFNALTQRYLIRAGFYYGNYDGLSRPPPFDLHINGRKWSTVNTSTVDGPTYHEAIYVTQGLAGTLDVCVVQVESGMVPFISSIEGVPIWVPTGSLYPQMETNYAYNLLSRVNYGGNEVRFSGLLTNERYNRVWTRGTTPPNCARVATVANPLPPPENDPPLTVLFDSIESLSLSDPITLSVDLPQTAPQSAYFVLYFTETVFPSNGIRTIQIYINGQMKSLVAPESPICKVITIYPVPVAGPTVNVTLASAGGSTLPPIISAMEVFTRVEANKSSSPPSPSSSPPSSTPSSYGIRTHFFYAYINPISCISLLLLFLA